MKTEKFYWAVLSRGGYVMPWTLCYAKRAAMEAACIDLESTWKEMKEKGYKAVKVSVMPFEEKSKPTIPDDWGIRQDD